MPASLFADLLPEQKRHRSGALPVSLALHGLAIAVVVSVAARPVALEMPTPSAAGPIAFTEAPLRPEANGSAKTLPPRLKAPLVRSRGPAPGPALVLDPPNLATGIVMEEAPAPCLRNCGDGSSLSSGEADSGFFTTDSGATGPGGGGSAPLPVGGNISSPLKLHDVAPVYPELARRARVQGVVIIRCVIDTDGRVAEAEVLRSVPLLDAAALEAVRQWIYRPTLLNGGPVAVVMTVTVQFRLQR